jgi:hypothetical protein
MEAFVTKTAKPRHTRPAAAPEAAMKQTTITSCKGVTSLDAVLPLIETIQLYSQLEIVDEVVIGELKRCMEALRGVRMHVDILRDTKIGATMNALRKHSSETVTTLASELYQDWRARAHDSLTRQVRRQLKEAGTVPTPSAAGKRRRQSELAVSIETLPISPKAAKQAKRTSAAEEFMRELAEWDDKIASASKRRTASPTPRKLPRPDDRM